MGGAAQVHVSGQGQVPDLPMFPQAGQTLRGQQVRDSDYLIKCCGFVNRMHNVLNPESPGKGIVF